MRKKPTILVILDGWGYRESNNFNAINNAHKPNWDQLWNNHPHTLINASGMQVGLPKSQMGNSEVGHINIGSGRIVYQELTRIDKEIEEKTFQQNSVLNNTIQFVKDHQSKLHIFGLLSPGGVHSHEDHIKAMIEFAADKGIREIYLHAFLDGRDVPPKSAQASIEAMDALLAKVSDGYIATVSGRYYAMDRDNRWERVQLAYDAMTTGTAEYQAQSAIDALDQAYARDETDEFVKPTIIHKNNRIITIDDNDAVVFMNFRADRAREISRTFVDANFDGFSRQKHPKVMFVCLTQYDAKLDCPVAYRPESLENILGEVISNAGKTQLRIAETEKYAHVTFFFNGGREQPFEGEERILVPSPKVATYDLQPEMSAEEVTDKLIDAIQSQRFDTIICNYANPDMVGHTGNYDAAVKAIEFIDVCLGRLFKAFDTVDADVFITADHGNADQMEDPNTHKPHTAHTTNLVPFVYYGKKKAQVSFEDGKLSDIAPTLLSVMNMPIPNEMTGKPLFTFQD